MRQVTFCCVVLSLLLVVGSCKDEQTVELEKPVKKTKPVEAEAVAVEKPVVKETKAATEAFFNAALDGGTDYVMSELDSGVDVNAVNPNGQTAMMLAAFNGHTQLVKKLIERGGDVNRPDVMGRTPLMGCSSGPFPETVDVLLAEGAKVNVADKQEAWTALMFAAAEGQADNVKLLLEHGADVTLQDKDGDTAESFASKAGHAAVAQMIREYGQK